MTTETAPRIMTFNEWVRRNDDLYDELATGEVTCLECDGYSEKPCPHCNQDMGCDECDGRGRVASNGDEDLILHEMKKRYELQVALDHKKLKDWEQLLSQEAA